MTDKEIIIDGIDVSGCIYLPYCEDKQGNCGNNPNCYFKQLKRKNAEYNKIAVLLRDTDIYSQVCETCRDEILIYPSISGKTNYTDNEVDIITLRRIINRLKNKEQKCKELEQEINHLKEQGSILLADKNAFQIGYDTSKARVKELEEILDEIEKELKEDIYCENQECGCDDFEECLKCTKEHILNIINSAKDGE